MRMIVFHSDESAELADCGLLQKAMSQEVIAGALFSSLRRGRRDSSSGVFIPKSWQAASAAACAERYESDICFSRQGRPVAGDWLVISNGRYFTGVEPLSILRRLNRQAGDVVAMNVDPRFKSGSEVTRFASDENVAGFRRFYDDGILPGAFPDRWPHHLAIKMNVLEKLAGGDAIPADFGVFLARCRANGLVVKGIQVGGSTLDLAKERDLAEFLTRGIEGDCYRKRKPYSDVENARVLGNVVTGKDVVLSEGALIAGPSIVGDRARIGRSAFVRSCVLGDDVSVQPGSIIQHRVLFDDAGGGASRANHGDGLSVSLSMPARRAKFRKWPKFSYAVAGKRIVDIAGSIAVLVLLAPVFPIVAAAIKLTSSGPVFFRHKREGLHGKEFGCLKFRTMIVGSDDIQQKLRSKNQVDGPQFKLEEDPRITPVGRFLRDTFIDEIPQFINILRGEMSVVGPRPSPRAENVMCAPWRDCRLSVRPGVTGLWQVSRTRRPGRDFQEWIHYDTMYVRNLSLGLDLRLVWRTIVKLTRDFVNQF